MELKQKIRIAMVVFSMLFIDIADAEAQFVARLDSYDGYWAG